MQICRAWKSRADEKSLSLPVARVVARPPSFNATFDRSRANTVRVIQSTASSLVPNEAYSASFTNYKLAEARKSSKGTWHLRQHFHFLSLMIPKFQSIVHLSPKDNEERNSIVFRSYLITNLFTVTFAICYCNIF